jgi:hypothetical protein
MEVRDEAQELRFLMVPEGIAGAPFAVDSIGFGGLYRQISAGGGTEFC